MNVPVAKYRMFLSQSNEGEEGELCVGERGSIRDGVGGATDTRCWAIFLKPACRYSTCVMHV